MARNDNFFPAELERQYNARAAIPEHVRILEEWAHESEITRHELVCQLDITYGAGTHDKLDLFLTDRPAAPLVVYIHGGYWQRGDRRDFSFLAQPWVANGVNAAMLGYGLCPHVTIGEIVVQVRRACAWLWRHAEQYRIDRQRIQVVGHSAGAHLTTMLCVTDWHEVDAGLPPRLLHSALAISGIYDLGPLRFTTMNDALELTAETVNNLSPLRYTPNSSVALSVAVGGSESREFHRQARELAETWRRHMQSLEVLTVPGRNHFTILEELAAPGVLFRRSLSLLGLPTI